MYFFMWIAELFEQKLQSVPTNKIQGRLAYLNINGNGKTITFDIQPKYIVVHIDGIPVCKIDENFGIEDEVHNKIYSPPETWDEVIQKIMDIYI